jgi:hypothetical protein
MSERPTTSAERYIRSVIKPKPERPPEPRPDKEGMKAKIKEGLKGRRLNVPENW